MNLLQKFWDRHVVLLMLTALFWAGNAVAGRIAIDDVSPFLLSFLRWFILLIFLWTLYWKDIKAAWPQLRDRWLYLTLMGGVGLAGFNLVFYKAAHYTTAVNIGILQGSIPLIVLLAAYLIYHSRITIVQLVGVLVGLAGVIMVAIGGVPGTVKDILFNRGDLMMAAACVLYAGYTVGLKSRPAVTGLVVFSVLCLPAALFSLPFAIFEILSAQVLMPTATGWYVIAYVVFLPSFLAQLFYLRSVDLVGPGRTGMFVNLTPVFAACLAVLLLNESFQLYHGAALLLVLGGLWLSKERASRKVESTAN
ncbi:MAG TPA: DMT family transporter [Gammaproteobacteria bacterium]|jgi:drug/metabolite transporter (DMT)-like permease|nr:DMT family transporter [Gammaproteobacteria bacterium]RTZ63839.1 MAG: EamA family transporter [Gammaproteobacteria bacterium]HAD38044.1 EamA family transporter [Gammaproteobacteria bacterium]HBK77231.1 EamA family transporter [Gammaproteobacteria bacterium]HHZ73029.1 DMT family transporter [Gammaproteobacteria bacterium]